jgi:hypothetical protein
MTEEPQNASDDSQTPIPKRIGSCIHCPQHFKDDVPVLPLLGLDLLDFLSHKGIPHGMPVSTVGKGRPSLAGIGGEQYPNEIGLRCAEGQVAVTFDDVLSVSVLTHRL